MSDCDQVFVQIELLFNHFLDAQQFSCQFNLGFVPVLAAFWTAWLFLGLLTALFAGLAFLQALAETFSASLPTTCSSCSGQDCRSSTDTGQPKDGHAFIHLVQMT